MQATENPDNLLATQVPTKFRSKYSDPNHPASLDPLGSFLTGGYTDRLHLESKAQAEAAQAEAQKLAVEAHVQADEAQAEAQRAIAEARARAGYHPHDSAPAPLVGGAPSTTIPQIPLDPLSQRLIEGSQRLAETQQRYIDAGTQVIQGVLQTVSPAPFIFL